jgi:putative peptidoglycan lipid II flippase
MYKHLLSVGGFTLLSRITGFLRDVMLGAILGAGALADAFVVAFRLPNHFRAIFGEGAFNAAYVPTYSRALEKEGQEAAGNFADQIFTLLVASQLALLVLAWLFMGGLIDLLAPGFRANPETFALAVSLTRITFPYLIFVTLVTLLSGTLNAHRQFAAAAAAPILLNVAMIATLALAFLFPSAAYAAAWGVALAGALELALLIWAARRAGVMTRFKRVVFDGDVARFFKTLGPAVIGSAGVQIAMFADTIIASLLPAGSVSSIYYADRLYQLPIGVIGVAAGTVLLPEMSRRFAAGDAGGAFHAQNRTAALTVALATPFLIAFLMIPDVIMRGVFLRGKFDAAAALAAANVLEAYGTGLIAIVLIRSAVASFQAQGDTKTPMVVSLVAVGVNVVLKLALYKSQGAPGLALATAIGAWVNFGLLVFLALRRNLMAPDLIFGKTAAAAAIAGFLLALTAQAAYAPTYKLAAAFGVGVYATHLALLGLIGTLVYGLALYAGLLVGGVKLGRAGAKADAPPAV